jgi:hypothetical protein
MAINFDTHEFIKTLEQAGMPEQQAEAISHAFKKAQEQVEPVTKDYLDAKLNDLKYEMVKWIAGMLLAQAGLVAALVKLL